jgi:uncharacterized protein (TIGR03118 family)
MTQHRWPAALVGAVLVGGVFAAPIAQAATGATYHQRNLVSDQPGMAETVDPNLVNPWGLSHGPATPLWVSDNGMDVSTLYSGAVDGSPVSTVPLVVRIPGGAPTGQVFNDTGAFTVPGTGQPSAFIFAGEGGFLSAWNTHLSDLTKAVLVAHTPGAVYKGLALVHSPYGPLLLAADFHDNRIDVFDRAFHRVQANFLYRDHDLPSNYAPFNVAEIGQRVVVTYAQQDAAGEDDVPGRGHGFVDVFTNYGHLVRRLVTGGPLNSPWGLTIAPAHFGVFSGALLIGNFGNGEIHAFNLGTGALLGTLRDVHHQPIVIDGLWALLPGNGTAGGTDAVWFSAGPQEESHGLLGQLTVNT